MARHGARVGGTRAALVDAVGRRDIDVAAWRPLAGYFAQRSPVPQNVAKIR